MKYVHDKSSFYSLNMIDETLYTFIKVMIDIAFREFRFAHFSKLDKHFKFPYDIAYRANAQNLIHHFLLNFLLIALFVFNHVMAIMVPHMFPDMVDHGDRF